MTTVLYDNGLVEIPEAFRKADALKAGQRCDIERLGHGEYRLRVSEEVADARPKERLIDVLMSCPVKDWWVGSDQSELTSLEPSNLFEQ